MRFVALPILPGSVSIRLLGKDGFTFVASPMEEGRVIFLSNLSPGAPPWGPVWRKALAQHGHLFPLAEEVWWERRRDEAAEEVELHKLRLR